MEDTKTVSGDAGESPVDPLLAAVGARIRKIRTDAGLRAIDVAGAAGITKAYLWRLEAGRQNVSLRSLSRIALALDTTMSNVLDEIAADPATTGVRGYTWRAGEDVRPRTAGRKKGAGDERADGDG